MGRQKFYQLLKEAEAVGNGRSVALQYESNCSFTVSVSGTFVGTVKIQGLTGSNWLDARLVDVTRLTSVTEITQPGVYAVAIPTAFSNIRAVVDSYTSGKITVTGSITEGFTDVLGVAATLTGASSSGGNDGGGSDDSSNSNITIIYDRDENNEDLEMAVGYNHVTDTLQTAKVPVALLVDGVSAIPVNDRILIGDIVLTENDWATLTGNSYTKGAGSDDVYVTIEHAPVYTAMYYSETNEWNIYVGDTLIGTTNQQELSIEQDQGNNISLSVSLGNATEDSVTIDTIILRIYNEGSNR